MAIFNEMLGGGINAKKCTATAANILSGKTAAVGKEIITGTMPNLSAKTTIDTAVDNVTPVIAGDQRFFFDNTDGVRRALIRYNGENGYLQGNTLFGVPAESKTVTPTASTQTVSCSEGKLLEKVTVSGVSNLTAANIKKGVNVGGVVGSYDGLNNTLVPVHRINSVGYNQDLDMSLHNLLTVASNGSRFYGIFGYGSYSADGKTWNQTFTYNYKNFPYYCGLSAYIPNYGWIVCRNHRSGNYDEDNNYAISTTGANFTVKSFPHTGDWVSLASSPTQIVALSGHSVGTTGCYALYSNDKGNTWSTISKTTLQSASTDSRCIYHNTLNKWFFFIGGGSNSYSMYVTSDLTAESTRISSIFGSGYIKNFYIIDSYVAVFHSSNRYNYQATTLYIVNDSGKVYTITSTLCEGLNAGGLTMFKHGSYYYIVNVDGNIYRSSTINGTYTLYITLNIHLIDVAYGNGILNLVTQPPTENSTGVQIYYMKIG